MRPLKPGTRIAVVLASRHVSQNAPKRAGRFTDEGTTMPTMRVRQRGSRASLDFQSSPVPENPEEVSRALGGLSTRQPAAPSTLGRLVLPR